ncbi:hypothetical protein GQ44DRAFT_774172 [Phaeosphaeriaceae sp. PMI808]|nr:hypothetical protein GQ44DRAFT_774172 [Phaeosphaeriaceae sp. PMI808]
MGAFRSNIADGKQCVSEGGVTCVYDNGHFQFPSGKIRMGNSNTSEDRGMGGFIGADHEYFLFCSQKHAEIALAKLNSTKKVWERYKDLTLPFDTNSSGEPIFSEIWEPDEKNIYYFVGHPSYSQEFDEFYGGNYVEVNLNALEVQDLNSEWFDAHCGKKIYPQAPSKSNDTKKPAPERGSDARSRLKEDGITLDDFIQGNIQGRLVYLAGHFSPSSQGKTKKVLEGKGVSVTNSLSSAVGLVIKGRCPSESLLQRIRKLRIGTVRWDRVLPPSNA